MMLQRDKTIKLLKKRFSNARAQARYKGQLWNIQFDDYCDIFLCDPKYLNSGVRPDSYNLCRIDQTGAWSIDNVVVRTRREHCSNLMMEKNRATRR